MGSISKKAVVLFLFSMGIAVAKAQQRYKWMVGINAGTMIYQGDLAPSAFGSYRTPSFTFGVSAAKILSPYFALRANAVFGNLRGDEAKFSNPSWRQHRNLNFSTPVTEFNAQLLWNPFGNNRVTTSIKITNS